MNIENNLYCHTTAYSGRQKDAEHRNQGSGCAAEREIVLLENKE